LTFPTPREIGDDESAKAVRLFHDLPFIGMAVTAASSKRWIQVNEALCDILGYPRAALVEKSWAELTHPDDLASDTNEFDRVTRGEIDGYKMDKRFIRMDGTIVHASIDVKAVRNATGDIDFFVATVADITARVEAEAAARRSAALLENLGRQVPGVIYQYQQARDGSARFPFASDAIREIFEVEPADVLHDASLVFSRVHPEDLERVYASGEASARSLEPWRCDFRVILPTRGLRWLHADARPERLPDGGTLWHGFITDSTERQVERAALLESEARFRVQIEHAPEAIVVYDADLDRLIDVNSNAERLFGLSRPELLARRLVDLSAPVQSDGRPSAEAGPLYVKRAIDGESPVFEWLHQHASGREIACEVRLVRLPAIGRSLIRGSITDISERKQAAQALTRLEAAITSSISGVAMADMDGRVIYVNRACLDLWGYKDAQEVLGREVHSFWQPRGEPFSVTAELQRTGSWSGERVAARSDGSERLMQVNASTVTDGAGVRVGMLAYFADITDRRKTEAALHVRDEAIRTAITAIAITDPDGRPVYANPAFVRLWGYESEEEVLGRDMASFLGSEPSMPVPDVPLLLAQGAWQGELTARRKDGSHFDMLVAANVVRDENGTVMHLMGSFLDITEAKRLQAQFLQAQKMESVGRLAGGVAHDFNNLLTVMQGCVRVVMDSVPSDGQLRVELQQISDAADSAAALTRQLLAFSRKQVIAPQVLDLNDVVRRVAGILERVLGADIRLQIVTADGLGAVQFDPGQAEQVLVNLAVNARDAMPDGGLLTLETSNVVLSEGFARSRQGVVPGDYVLLEVSDTGRGMSNDTKEHAFEPFFTTKEVGQGTGLGLAMIHGAVTQNGGLVEVSSELGEGTSFRIYLPRVNAPVTPVPKMRTAGPLPRGNETVMLVEDDDAVREFVRRLLDRQGYRVLPFGSGADALQWLSGAPEPVHLLLTDVIMPGMNGKVLAEHVRAALPEVRILYTSGYTANLITQNGVLEPGAEFLAKPFTSAVLAGTVRELLDRNQAGVAAFSAR
jgi:PAS domain S-box-containing protein